MNPSPHLSSADITELFSQVTCSGKITMSTYAIVVSLVNSPLNESERRLVDRILYAIRRGRVQIIEDIKDLVLVA